MKYKSKRGEEEEDVELEPQDCLLIEAIDNLSEQIRRLVSGR